MTNISDDLERAFVIFWVNPDPIYSFVSSSDRLENGMTAIDGFDGNS